MCCVLGHMQLLCRVEDLFCIPGAVLQDCCSFNYSLILKDQRSLPQSSPCISLKLHTHTHGRVCVCRTATWTHLQDIGFVEFLDLYCSVQWLLRDKCWHFYWRPKLVILASAPYQPWASVQWQKGRSVSCGVCVSFYFTPLPLLWQTARNQFSLPHPEDSPSARLHQHAPPWNQWPLKASPMMPLCCHRCVAWSLPGGGGCWV